MNIIFLGGGYSQLPYIKILKEKYKNVFVFDINPKAVAKKIATKFYCCSINDYESIIDELEKNHPHLKNEQSFVLTNIGGNVIKTLNKVSSYLGLSSFSEKAVKAAQTKSGFKRSFSGIKCSDNYLLNVDYYKILVSDKVDWAKYHKKWPLGIFIKPDYSPKSKIAHALKNGKIPPKSIFSFSQNYCVVIEPLIPDGEDWVDLVLVRDGKIISNGLMVKELNILSDVITGVGFCVDDSMDDCLKKELRNLTQKYIEDLQIINSPVAVSYRVHENIITPVELHLDFGGENIYAHAYNLNLESLLNHYFENDKLNTLIESNEKAKIIIYSDKLKNINSMLNKFKIKYEIMEASTNRKQYVFTVTKKQQKELYMELKI